MTVTIRRPKSKRLRSPEQLKHVPSGFGHGKWHSRATLWRYKRRMRVKKQVASASRLMNRLRAK